MSEKIIILVILRHPMNSGAKITVSVDLFV